MQLQRREDFFSICMKSFFLFLCVCAFVLLVNAPFISFDMMYFEQPTLYLVNQKIMSVHDLLQVYLHPMMLDSISIPFFRPSGHFLIYQILTKFLDWHNTQGFLIVNFIFLAVTCYVMIKLYDLLFPRYQMGAYLACGIYLMHPALLLSRISPMHFEFACVCFVMLSLYCFVLFYQKNQAAFQVASRANISHYGLLVLSLFFYALSVTFKEAALILGPVLVTYLCIVLYQGASLLAYVKSLLRQQNVKQIILLFGVMTVMLATYLSMVWPGFSHPLLTGSSALSNSAIAFVKLLAMLFGFVLSEPHSLSLLKTIFLWDAIIFTPCIYAILWGLLGVMVFGIYHFFIRHRKDVSGVVLGDKKSFLFLVAAMLLFLALPIAWGRARPWHLAFSLVFFSMMLGFCFDYFCHQLLRNKKWINSLGAVLIVLSGFAGFSVEALNVTFLKTDASNFPLRLDRNAVLHAPDIKNQLNAESVLIVEDSTVHSDYLLGNSVYPLELYSDNLDLHRLIQLKGFYAYPYVYGGTLFKWAYLMPNLQEQVFPFEINKMRLVSTLTIYNWLRHYDNIFCVGYDQEAVWHDKTLAFKKNLLLEKIRRHVIVNQYKTMPVFAVNKNSKAIIRLPFKGDISYCQFRCDGNKSCQGFIYTEDAGKPSCYFHDAKNPPVMSACTSCQKFMKLSESPHV